MRLEALSIPEISLAHVVLLEVFFFPAQGQVHRLVIEFPHCNEESKAGDDRH